MKKLLFFLLLAFEISANAQYVANYKKVADSYFEKKDYYAASTFYKKALKISGDSASVLIPYGGERNPNLATDKGSDEYESSIYNLAESSRMYKEFTDAEKYYAMALGFTDNRYRLAQFYYGESLRANRKFDQAIAAFQQFIQKHPEESLVKQAKMEIESCKYALVQIRNPRMLMLKKVPNDVNDLGSNYAATALGNTLYFTSSRPNLSATRVDPNGKAITPSKETPFRNGIYVAKGNLSAKKISVSKVNLSNQKDLEVAAPSLSPDGNTMYYTVWMDKGNYAICRSKKLGSQWESPQLLGLEVNTKGYNSLQPFVTKDGKYLIFASDRPGGVGKFDLWFCTLRADGTLGQPVNLGASINTEGDERAPYYNVNTKKLLFSSDGRIGLGGLDFYQSEGDFASWTEPVNMGYPFNSTKDDVYFTATDEKGTRGYISSDRESACCLELYQIKKEYLTLSGTLTDCKTKLPLANVDVKIAGDEGEQNMKTGADGKYSFKLETKNPLKVTYAKDNYFAVSKSYNANEMAKVDTLISVDYCLAPFKLGIPIVLNNVYYEFNSAELTDSSKKVLDLLVPIMVDNPQMEIELGAHTDNIGKDDYNLDLSNRRAKSCVDYLISKGIEANRMTSKGYGKTMPVAPNTIGTGKKKKDNPAGRAKNRRTEFKVTKK